MKMSPSPSPYAQYALSYYHQQNVAREREREAAAYYRSRSMIPLLQPSDWRTYGKLSGVCSVVAIFVAVAALRRFCTSVITEILRFRARCDSALGAATANKSLRVFRWASVRAYDVECLRACARLLRRL